MGAYWEKDSGWNKFVKDMKAASGEREVFVGYLRSAPAHKPKGKKGKPIKMAALAAVHEFGSSDGRIPERSFMRSAVADGTDKLKKMCKKLSLDVTQGRMSKDKALGILGQFMVDLMRGKIAQSVPPPNKPATIKAKGSAKTLVDTGQLMGALNWELVGGKKT